MNHCAFFFYCCMKIFSNLQKKEKEDVFLTQLTAALWCLAHKAKCYFSCAALVIHITAANVLNRKEREANTSSLINWEMVSSGKAGSNATGRLPWERVEGRYLLLDKLIQNRCLNLWGSLHHNGSITNSMSTSRQRKVNYSSMAKKTVTYSPRASLQKNKAGKRKGFLFCYSVVCLSVYLMFSFSSFSKTLAS